MNDNKLMLYTGNDQMEAAMLRSVMLFNGRNNNISRHDMKLKAILAIIICGDGTTKVSDIEGVLNNRFGISLNEKEIPQQLSKLKGLIEENSDGTISVKASERGKGDFFKQLNDDTNDGFRITVHDLTKL